MNDIINEIFKPFQTVFRNFVISTFSSNVQNNTNINGSISIKFSKHSVVSYFSPFFSPQIHQSPITFDNGFAHMFLLINVLNKIITEKKKRMKSLRKKIEVLNSTAQPLIAFFNPFPLSTGL